MTLQRSTATDVTTVLFVGERNAGASLIAEALLRHRSGKDVRAFSAGIAPADRADPLVMAELAKAGVPYDGLWPKHWLGFAAHNRLKIEHLIIVGCSPVPATLCALVDLSNIHHWPSIRATDTMRLREGWLDQWQKRIDDLIREIDVMREMGAITLTDETTTRADF